MVNRPITRFAAWYEFFPRSQSTVPGSAWHAAGQHPRACARSRPWASTSSICRRFTRSATASARARTTAWSLNRAMSAAPGRSATKHGGHMALEPQLGTWDDWDEFVAACRELEIEIALDYVMNCSPDHPYVDRASRVVLPSSRRLDQVRREPAQEVPGCLPAQLRHQRPRRALAGDAQDLPVLGRQGRDHFPR